MKRLWAPWRMQYIKTAYTEPGCIFCDKPAKPRSSDRQSFIVYRGRFAFAMMNIYPYSNGHIMIAPYLHVATIEDLPSVDSLEVMTLAQRSIHALRAAFSPDGFNLGMNLGRVAGAGVESHVHMHIVPRWNGDTNFMPILAETKVMPEHLENTYDKLLPYFTRARSGKSPTRSRKRT